MKIEFDQKELEDMVRDLLLKPRGLKLADVAKPLLWKRQPQLRVVLEVINDPAAPTKEEEIDKATTALRQALVDDDDDEEQRGRRQRPPKKTGNPRLDPHMFPPGANVQALTEAAEADAKANDIPLGPDESFERPPPPKRGAGR